MTETDDKFAWLEENSDRTAAWECAQSARAADWLRNDAGYVEACDALAKIPTVFRAAPIHAGGFWFRIILGQRGMVVSVAESAASEGKTLFEAADSGDGAIILQCLPSTTGRYVAVLLATSPSASITLRIVDRTTGEFLSNRLSLHAGMIGPGLIAWLPDDTGLYAVTGSEPGRRWGKRRLVKLTLDGDAVPEPVEIERLDCEPQVSPDGQHVLLLQRTVAGPYPTHIKDESSDQWLSFLPDCAGRCRGVFHDSQYIAITTEGAPRGRLVAIPLKHASNRSSWTELLPQSNRVMWTVAWAGDALLIGELADDTVHFRLVAPNGKHLCELPSAGPGAVGVVGPARSAGTDMASASSMQIAFTLQTQTSSAALYVYDIASGSLNRVEAPVEERKHLVSRRLFGTASDGTTIPIQITHRADLDLFRTNPMILTAYGGVGVADLPGFSTTMLPFMEAGGIYGWATIRGGAEFGDEWRDGGSGINKERTFEDFCDAAHFLIESRVTEPAKLGIFGASNGGLLVSAAVTREPELFAAAVPHIPFTDLSAYCRDALTVGWLAYEWGDPAVDAERERLRAISPYYNIRADRSYPPILTIAGSADDMSPAWHARKFAARMQDMHGEDAILFRLWEGFGHIEAAAAPPPFAAEWLSFLTRKLGVSL